MFRSLALSLSASLLAFGCSSNNGKTMMHPPIVTGDMAMPSSGGADMALPTNGGGDGGALPPDLAGLPAPDHDPTQHPPLPRFNSATSKGTITAPEVWTVVWKGDEAVGEQVNKFVDAYLHDDAFTKSLQEYGVGAGTAKGVLVLPDAPPSTIDDSALNALVDNNLGKGAWPAAGDNVIIAFVSNAKTTVTLQGSKSCVDFGGYHQVSKGGTQYLVDAYCNDPTTMKPDWDELTVTVSHEIGEAASDPSPNIFFPSNAAVDSATGLPFLGGGEVGDMCINLNHKLKSAAGDEYLVQRMYSDSAAAAGTADPCLPGDGPYFGAGLYGNNPSDLHVVTITRDNTGKGSATIKIEPFAMDPSVGPIGFYVVGSLVPDGVTLSPNIARKRDANGNVVGMRIWGNPGSTTEVKVNVDATFQPTLRPTPFLVVAQTQDLVRVNIWWGTLVIK